MPDCQSHSCLYAKTKTGMRTNGRCRCDECEACGGTIRPSRPVKHYHWCPQPDWVPEHHRSAATPVEPGTGEKP